MKVNIISGLHRSVKRDYMVRMSKDKPTNMKLARLYGFNYWDGDRQFGYGGYKYDGRWIPIAKKLIKRYNITSKSRVLDMGCGKGFLVRDIEDLSHATVLGSDISEYALDRNLLKYKYKFDMGKDTLMGRYDLIISINVLHNLILPELKHAIEQINEHSKQAYIVVESYRNEQELSNLQCWSLTCEQFNRPEEWEFLFKEWGYKGDYEFIYFS